MGQSKKRDTAVDAKWPGASVMIPEVPAGRMPPARPCKQRLRLALRPVVPYRCPDGCAGVVRYGYDLRLSGGPRLVGDDPVLAVFGACVGALDQVEAYSEELQSDGFDPGRDIRLMIERNVDGTSVVAVWDVEQICRAGQLDGDASALTMAAAGHGLEQRAVVLDEGRSTPDDWRVSLTILVFAERFVRLDVARARYTRPAGPQRRRVVLVLDKSSELRWWDTDTTAGPSSIDELPISAQLRDDLLAFARKARKLQKKRARHTSSHDRYELDRAQERLDQRALELWLSVRCELARDHVVGFLGPNMVAPAWSHADLPGRSDDGWEEILDLLP